MFKPTAGPARERIDSDEVAALRRAGTLVTDDRRVRPLYFDGRFLAARDLVREQNYFLTRESDLGLAGGAGVAHGLLVRAGPGATEVTIAAGHGVTTGGELVLLEHELKLNLADLALAERLDRAFGLLPIPHEPARNRSGLYIVALRPVEYTANPIASYPTSIDHERSVEDGDIVEGVAVTLIPYADRGLPAEAGLRRARVARQIFVEGGDAAPSRVLPLAIVAVTRGVIDWVDPYLVRREIGAEQDEILGLGFAPRALREAHALQYDHHLAEALAERDGAGRPRRFQASEVFQALPPAGRMPAAGIEPAGFMQTFFPAEVDVELSIIPEDEVPALLEESLQLPPIDLTLEGDDLESTAVLVLVPVPRARLAALRATLANLTRTLRPAAPGLVGQRRPLESLLLLRPPRVIARPPVDPADAAWAGVINGVAGDGRGLLWYARRRNLAYRANVTGAAAETRIDDFAVEGAVRGRLATLGLDTLLNDLRGRASAEGGAEMVRLLSTGRLEESRLLTEGAVAELNSQRQLDRRAVLEVAERFSRPELGEGIHRLEAAQPEIRTNETVVKTVAGTGLLPEIDRLARTLNADDLAAFAGEVATAAESGNTVAVTGLIRARLGDVEPTR